MDQQHQDYLGILCVDVVVSSPVHGPAGDDATLAAVRECLALCEKFIIERGGSVVKTAADGAMYALPDADSAVLAAGEIQVRMRQNQAGNVHDVSLRIGLHFGSPITAGAAAQRVALLAGSGQIFTTGETLAWISADQRDAIRKRVLPSHTKQGTVTAYEVMWQTNNPDHCRQPAAPAPVSRASRLRLNHLARETEVVTRITIGRRAGHGIELNDPMASRDHAYIERRQDSFVLVDQSSHGTFISLDNGQEYRVRHGEAVLLGSGLLSFAHCAGHEGSEIVSFRCESADAAVPLSARR